MSLAGWVLVVEGNPILRQEWAAGLEERGGFAVRAAATLQDAECLIEAAEHNFDAIVLNERLADGSGNEFCADLRAREDWTPVIIVASRAGEIDILRSFEAGADDHMTRPSIAELVARLRAQIRAASRPIIPFAFAPAFAPALVA